MGCCNEPSVALNQSGQNPTLHVNYTKGMVLGVDDFTQEFTYLSNRDQWAVRELHGYGTTSGLAVFIEDAGEDGPRIHVKRGAAVVPSGKLVCVPNDQCALLNQWLAKAENADKINQILAVGSPPSSPPTSEDRVSLYLVLCYKNCTTMPVPIPGDPCRSEDQLMADSRIADDYHLEMRTEALPQTEDDAVQDFVAWLKQHVSIIETSSPPESPPDSLPDRNEKNWLDGLKIAIKPWFDVMEANPTKSPVELHKILRDYLSDGSPPIVLSVTRELLCHFLRVAFRFWVVELRPLWMARMCATVPGNYDDCVLLARLEVPVILAGGTPTGAWQVSGKAEDIMVDESERPYLVHMRLLQEWLLCNAAPEQVGPSASLPRAFAPVSRPDFARVAAPGTASIAIINISADLTLNESHHCIVCHDGPTLNLPKCGPDNQGRVYIIKSNGKPSTIKCNPTDKIEGKDSKAVGISKAVTLVSDGEQNWHIIAVV